MFAQILLAALALRPAIASSHKILAEDTWYGFHRTKFEFAGRTAWVVEPNGAPAASRPWTWTMQWAEAFVDRTGALGLLKEGYHHVTIDLFDTRMDEKGVAVAADFQRFLVTQLGFAPKARLIGMSWGGFFSTRYAAAFPQNVRCIYLDAPLLNLEGFKAMSAGPWRKAEGALWTDDPRMPVNLAAPLARAHLPILLLYGGQDQTVMPLVNAELFAARFKAAGGDIRVVKRECFGHHPHGLDPDKTSLIVDFLR